MYICIYKYIIYIYIPGKTSKNLPGCWLFSSGNIQVLDLIPFVYLFFMTEHEIINQKRWFTFIIFRRFLLMAVICTYFIFTITHVITTRFCCPKLVKNNWCFSLIDFNRLYYCNCRRCKAISIYVKGGVAAVFTVVLYGCWD